MLCCAPAGATLYIEPSELLELNNKEAQLADEEAQAELAVLQVRGEGEITHIQGEQKRDPQGVEMRRHY